MALKMALLPAQGPQDRLAPGGYLPSPWRKAVVAVQGLQDQLGLYGGQGHAGMGQILQHYQPLKLQPLTTHCLVCICTLCEHCVHGNKMTTADLEGQTLGMEVLVHPCMLNIELMTVLPGVTRYYWQPLLR